MAETPSPIWRQTLGRRLPVGIALLALWTVGIEARLVYWQVVKHDELVAQATRQQSATVDVPASRGELRDRNGRVLAVSGVAPSIRVLPPDVKDPAATIDAVCRVLGDCSKDERATFLTRVTTPGRKSVYFRRLIDPEQRDRIAKLNLPGIYFVDEPRRFHPNGSLAAHLLGYVSTGVAPEPLSGLELAYRQVLEGTRGKAIITTDASKIPFTERIEIAPTAGASLELTIDARMQAIAERELQRGVEENHALSGSVIVMDPWQGELLALANFPTFDPDSRRGVSPSLLRNGAVEDQIEPGSTFKIVTASAALEQRVVTPDEIIELNGGRIRLGSDDVVLDTHPYQQLSFTDVIVKSSNVGAIKIGQRLGRERLMEYVKRFGFGKRTDKRDFPSESAGQITEAAKLTDRTLARVSMGYTVGVTPLQLAAAVSSIANGGELLQPRVVRRVIRGREFDVRPRVVVRRTVPAEVTAELTTIMEGVVDRGTATSAQIAGFSIAGKTGTASRLVGGHYSKTEYNASFVGFVPSRRPVYTIVVVINSPHGKNGYYGGVVSAPVFRRIAEQLLAYGGVQRTVEPPPPVLVERQPAGGREVPTSNRGAAPVVRAPAVDDGLVPDLTGLSAREAMRTMLRLGLTPSVHGVAGLVVDQRPAAGTRLEPGLKATLWLGREYIPRKVDTATQ